MRSWPARSGGVMGSTSETRRVQPTSEHTGRAVQSWWMQMQKLTDVHTSHLSVDALSSVTSNMSTCVRDRHVK